MSESANFPAQPDFGAVEVRRPRLEIVVLEFRRPGRMNALDPSAAAALREGLRQATSDTAARVMILHGAGGHFCTGFDLKHKRQPGEEGVLAILQDCLRILQQGRLPSIAAIEGNAFGAGMSLALACDQIVAGDGAKLCAPFTGIGLLPDVGMAATLERRVGPGRARRWMFEGSIVPTTEALSAGLIDVVVPHAQALDAATEQARAWSERAPLAIASLRKLLQWPESALEQLLAQEASLQQELALTQDHLEAVAAFAERRRPVFRGA